jgi:hypothetical protein
VIRHNPELSVIFRQVEDRDSGFVFSGQYVTAVRPPLARFSFDRPGSGIGTGITPVGQLAWEQGLANAHYAESTTADGEKVKTTSLNADMLLHCLIFIWKKYQQD